MAQEQKIIGYDPETGKPVIGYDANTGGMIFAPVTSSPPTLRDAAAQIDQSEQERVADGRRNMPSVLATMASFTPQGRILKLASKAPSVVSGLVSRFPRIAQATVRATTAGAAGGVGSVARSATDDIPETMGDVANNAGAEILQQGGMELLGPVISHGGRGVANVFMRRALGPSKAAGLKYGDLPGQALDRRTLVSEGGADKAQGIREAAQARKVSAIENARPVSILTAPIKRGAADQTIDAAVGQQIAGMRPTMDPSHVVERFGAGRPGISLKESELAKKQFDNATDAARQAKRMGKRPQLGDEERIALSREILESQDQVVPGMRQMNRDIGQSFGLEQAIRQRIAQPGAGLADEAAIMGSMVDPRMALSRVIREPQALSAVAILVNELSKGGRVTPTAIRALLASSHAQEPN